MTPYSQEHEHSTTIQKMLMTLPNRMMNEGSQTPKNTHCMYGSIDYKVQNR